MNIKNIFKNLKSEKGLTGADVAVSLSIIATTIVVITMVYLNISNNNKSVDRTAGATRLATNILENIQAMEYDEIQIDKDTNSDGILEPTKVSGGTIYNTKIPSGYTATVSVTEQGDTFALVKKVDVEIAYKVGGENKKISVSTAIEKTVIPECNLPQTSTTFLNNSEDESGVTQSLADKELIPIKYSNVDKSYVKTTESDIEWYNYSVKEWAKVLAFSAEDIDTAKKTVEVNGETKSVKNAIIDNMGNINTNKLTITILNEDGTKAGEEEKSYLDYLYVWIPNFGKTADVTEADGTTTEGVYYFRYGAESNTSTTNAINIVTENVKGINLTYNNIDSSIVFSNSIEMNSLGFWRLYNETPTEDTIYGQLNSSQYGPQIMH